MSDHSSHAVTEELYRDHHSWLRAWLRRRLSNSADASDLMQDTFFRLLTAPPVVIDTPRAYLATVANRLASNLLRRRSLEQTYLDTLASLPEAEVPSLEQQALILEALQTVDTVLDQLPARVRRAFLMAQLEGYSQQEIAAILDTSVRSVQRYIARAYEEFMLLAVDLP